ncbi:hypothetical protein CI109_106087 [Kwoniella shandongensis]|uniref:Uncharacterized protein n=1 Tax=Kwoniella shandongensis TaxID=1734106 RepID=A0A5M6BQY4_9TREE|nr:uncharacterized protein CI109_006375 [Kwoniella shandongensis]KAA5525304.1 hypothetical protein CI109_006375 [Kwoniella shandongensis]
MFPDLPEHLQTLNALPGNSPPTAGMNQEQEEAFWGFLHADELFRNFGNVPSPSEQEDKQKQQQLIDSVPSVPAPTPVTAPTPLSTSTEKQNRSGNAPTLESFIAAFIGQPGAASSSSAQTPSIHNNYLIPLPAPYTNTAAPTPAAIPTSEVLPGPSSMYGDFGDSPSEDGRISGAKRLKSLGAPQVEIEEDKRRRNTEASARFRAKKKEREQALERRAKELEAQVAALAAENSSLENENRLLKAIVLNGGSGDASAAAAAVAAAAGSNGRNADALQSALAALGQKRKRDE